MACWFSNDRRAINLTKYSIGKIPWVLVEGIPVMI